MKLRLATIPILAAALFACQQGKSDATPDQEKAKTSELTKADLTKHEDKFSYALGMDAGRNLKRDEIEVNEEALLKGLRDALADGTMLLTDEELRDVKREQSKKRMALRKTQREAAGKKNREEGAKYLAENKKKEGVTVTDSGLQYRIITKGTGPTPKETDTVSVHYKGTLLDGKEFDSSHTRGKPAEFPVNRVVKGWTEALQLMPVGSKWELVIPSDLAYGPRGAGREIGPDAVLVFEVELLEIVNPEKKK